MRLYPNVVNMGESTPREYFDEKAMYMAIISGILLLIAGASGAATWKMLRDAILENYSSDILAYVFVILILLASLGGILVIVAGLIIKKGDRKKGRLLITIGVGTGLIGLIIMIISSFLGNGTVLAASATLVAGIGLSIIARDMAKE